MTTAPRSDLADVKALLQSAVASLAQHLAPDGHRSGKYWIARNPTRDDRRAGSFWISLTGVPGAWRDEATGDKGDVLQLVQYCLRLPDLKAALAWSRDWLGIERLPESERRQRIQAVAQDRRREDAAAVEEAEKNKRRALATFIRAKDRRLPFLGSPADLYLRGRGIEVGSLGRMPGALGWLPDQRHTETGTQWPVMLAGFTCPTTLKIVAVHRTFLMPDGSAKAPVEHAKKIWPRGYEGSAIRLWRGASKLSPEEAARHGLRETLVLAEGIENGMSVVVADPELRVWSVGTIGNFAHVRLPECCDEVLVVADNDDGNPQAQRQFARGVDALVAQGRPVRVARSTVGKDINDCLRGAGRA